MRNRLPALVLALPGNGPTRPVRVPLGPIISCILIACAPPRETPDSSSPPTGGRRHGCGSRHRGRLRRLANPKGPRGSGYNRLQPGRRAFSPRMASAGVGRPPMSGSRTQRHRSHGRYAASSLPVSGSTRRFAAEVGRQLFPGIPSTRQTIFGSAGWRRHGWVSRRNLR